MAIDYSKFINYVPKINQDNTVVRDETYNTVRDVEDNILLEQQRMEAQRQAEELERYYSQHPELVAQQVAQINAEGQRQIDIAYSQYYFGNRPLYDQIVREIQESTQRRKEALPGYANYQATIGQGYIDQGYERNQYNQMTEEQARRNAAAVDFARNTYLNTGRGDYFTPIDPRNPAAVESGITSYRVGAFDSPIYGAMFAAGAGTPYTILGRYLGSELGSAIMGGAGEYIDRNVFGGDGSWGRGIGSFAGGLAGYGVGPSIFNRPLRGVLGTAENYAARRGASSVLYPRRNNFGYVEGGPAFQFDPYQRYTGYRMEFDRQAAPAEFASRDINVGPGGYEPGKPGSGSVALRVGATFMHKGKPVKLVKIRDNELVFETEGGSRYPLSITRAEELTPVRTSASSGTTAGTNPEVSSQGEQMHIDFGEPAEVNTPTSSNEVFLRGETVQAPDGSYVTVVGYEDGKVLVDLGNGDIMPFERRLLKSVDNAPVTEPTAGTPAQPQVQPIEIPQLGSLLERNGKRYALIDDNGEGMVLLKGAEGEINIPYEELANYKVISTEGTEVVPWLESSLERAETPTEPVAQRPVEPSSEPFEPMEPTGEYGGESGEAPIEPEAPANRPYRPAGPQNTPNAPKRSVRTKKYPARIINTIDYNGKTYEVIRKNDNVTILRDPDTGSKIELTNDEVIEAMDRGEFGNETYTDQFSIYSNVPYTKQADPVWAGTNQRVPSRLKSRWDSEWTDARGRYQYTEMYPKSMAKKLFQGAAAAGAVAMLVGGVVYWLWPNGKVYDPYLDKEIPKEEADSIKKEWFQNDQTLKVDTNQVVPQVHTQRDSSNTYYGPETNLYQEKQQEMETIEPSGDTIWDQYGGFRLRSQPGYYFEPEDAEQ